MYLPGPGASSGFAELVYLFEIDYFNPSFPVAKNVSTIYEFGAGVSAPLRSNIEPDLARLNFITEVWERI